MFSWIATLFHKRNVLANLVKAFPGEKITIQAGGSGRGFNLYFPDGPVTVDLPKDDTPGEWEKFISNLANVLREREKR